MIGTLIAQHLFKPAKNLNKVKILTNVESEELTVATKFSVFGRLPQISGTLKMSFQLMGEDGCTSVMEVEALDTGEFSFLLNLPDIGHPQILRCTIEAENVENIGEWFIEKIEVSLEEVGTSFQFFHHQTVSIPDTALILFEGKGYLPQNENEYQRKARQAFIEKKCKLFRWKKDQSECLPAYADVAECTDSLLNNFVHYLPKTKWKSASLSHLDLEKNDFLIKDEAFGRMYLQGAHCNFIKIGEELPVDLNVSESFFSKRANAPLSEIMKKGRLFIADYELLKDIIISEKQYLTAPIVLFYSDVETGNLYPMMIQLERDDYAPVFTPEDTTQDWILAKIWVRQAATLVHQLSSQFLLTNAVTEAFALAAHRTFTPAHPIYQLLFPHFENTFYNSAKSRQALLNQGNFVNQCSSTEKTVLQQIMEKSYRQMSIKNAMNFQRNLTSRGVVDRQVLPNYAYRDDGILIWKSLQRYVNRNVQAYYQNDEEVVEDFLLQEWLIQFQQRGYKYNDWGTRLQNRENLTDLLTSIIFTATVVRQFTNDTKSEIDRGLPNLSAMLFTPSLRGKGITSETDVLTFLANTQMTATFPFSMQKSAKNIKLAAHQAIFSVHRDCRLALLRFRKELEKIEQVIEARNEERAVPYLALLPSRISNSGEC